MKKQYSRRAFLGLSLTSLASLVYAESTVCESDVIVNDPEKGLMKWSRTGVEDGVITFKSGNGYLSRINKSPVNVQWFGAKGLGDKRLYSIPRRTSEGQHYYNELQTTYATEDEIAINKAIEYLKSIGGGDLYIPKGTYYIYGYLDDINFSCNIQGDDKENTILINHEARDGTEHGFGILNIEPKDGGKIRLKNIKFDGNAQNKNNLLEVVNHTVGVYGYGNVEIDNVDIVNAACDCLYVYYDKEGNKKNISSLKVTNCLLSNSYRNTLSLICGSNVEFTDTIIEGGGRIHDGISPKAGVDLEPDNEEVLSELVTFTRCTFRESEGYPITGGRSYGKVSFNDCLVQVNKKRKNEADQNWIIVLQGGQITFNRCKIEDKINYNSAVFFYFPVTYGQFTKNEYTKYIECEFEGVGVLGVGWDMYFDKCKFKNSLNNISFYPDQEKSKSITLTNCEFINIFESNRVYNSSLYLESNAYPTTINISNISFSINQETIPEEIKKSYQIPQGFRRYYVNIKNNTKLNSIEEYY
jgi:hypothetical protein